MHGCSEKSLLKLDLDSIVKHKRHQQEFRLPELKTDARKASYNLSVDTLSPTHSIRNIPHNMSCDIQRKTTQDFRLISSSFNPSISSRPCHRSILTTDFQQMMKSQDLINPNMVLNSVQRKAVLPSITNDKRLSNVANK